MGIEYMIDFPCRPKKELGEEHMINLVKHARETTTKKSVGSVETAQILEVPVEGMADNPEAKLRKDLADLSYYVSDCLSCPVNVAADKSGSGPEAAFGCMLHITYPISADVETALLAGAMVALADPASNPGSKLVLGILRSHAKGKKTPAHRVRKMGREYFEARAPKAAKVEIDNKRLVIDTDQLMTLLMIGPVPVSAEIAFASFLDKGVEQAKNEGVTDPWKLAPLKKISEHMMVAHTAGRPVKVKF
jgi:hypothetical protein